MSRRVVRGFAVALVVAAGAAIPEVVNAGAAPATVLVKVAFNEKLKRPILVTSGGLTLYAFFDSWYAVSPAGALIRH